MFVLGTQRPICSKLATVPLHGSHCWPYTGWRQREKGRNASPIAPKPAPSKCHCFKTLHFENTCRKHSWKTQLCKLEFNLYIWRCCSRSWTGLCFFQQKSCDLQSSSSLLGSCYHSLVLVQHRSGGKNDNKNMNAFSPHLERWQAQQQAALYSALSTRMLTREEKQHHGSSSCRALLKLSFNEIN